MQQPSTVLLNLLRFRSPLPSIAALLFIPLWMHGRYDNNHDTPNVHFVISMSVGRIFSGGLYGSFPGVARLLFRGGGGAKVNSNHWKLRKTTLNKIQRSQVSPCSSLAMPMIISNGICSTLSTVCFPPCNKWLTIFKQGLITDSILQNIFSFYQHMRSLKRGNEKKLFAGRIIYDWCLEGILFFAQIFVLFLEELRGPVLMNPVFVNDNAVLKGTTHWLL